MNTVDLVGRIASDIRLREFPGAEGTRTKASFVLVVPRPRRDADPDWVRIETWGKQAENLVRFNGKGSRVAIRGRLRGRFFNPNGGERGGELRTSVVAEEITYLGTRPSAPASAPAPVAEPTAKSSEGRR
jgi:single-strand DNA-binding protein